MDPEQEQRFRFQMQLEQELSQQSEQAPSTPPQSSMMDVAKSAVNEAFMRPGTSTRDLMTNPITQAKALPALAGAAGGMAPVPFGATMGTVAGRQISNLAMKAYGKPELIPPASSQVLEAGAAMAGDVMALPYIKKSYYGKQIANAEQAAGVPPPQDISSLPRPTGTQTVSSAIDDAVNSIKTANPEKTSPVFWKQLKDQIDFFYQRGRDEVLSNGDRAKLAWLSSKIQEGLNTSIPGRAEPARMMSKSMAIPNAISGAYKALPRRARIGLEYFGPAGAATLAADYARRKLGGQ